ncbi:acyl-CoA thioesterase [Undibacterium sp. Ji67W]|uniref:acyl-CoA thioesterase n=1 Tax=Undibacterium sp. Ji67W TaxID=3413042 RepID=UPI003BF2FFCE
MTQLTMMEWLISYADTDAGGVVYHGRYIEQAERSRHRLLLDINHPFSKIETESICLLVVRAINANYQKPAFLGQKLQVATRIQKLSEAYSIWETRFEYQSECLCLIAAKLVCLSAQTRTLRTMPENLYQSLLTLTDRECCAVS